MHRSALCLERLCVRKKKSRTGTVKPLYFYPKLFTAYMFLPSVISDTMPLGFFKLRNVRRCWRCKISRQYLRL